MRTLFFCLCTILIIGCADDKTKEKESFQEGREEIMDEDIKEERMAEDGEKVILFFGNSLSAGYGLKEGESFPDRIQEKIDEDDLKYLVVNAGNSGETTAGGEARIDWVLNQDIDIFVLELGGNDILRGIDVKNSEKNLRSILEKVRAKNESIRIILAGMQAPPNMGGDYTDQFSAIYPKLAAEFKVDLIPFLLDKVGGMPDLNQPDGIHPNIEGAQIVANTVWQTLEPLL